MAAGSNTLPPFSNQVMKVRYACLEMQPRAVRELTVSCVGVECCQPDYRVERSGYGCLGLEFVAEGSGSLVLDGRTYALGPGHCFTYGPRVPHLIVSDLRKPLRKYFVDFFGKEGTALLAQMNLTPPFCGLLADAGAVLRLFDELLREAGRGGAQRQELAAAYLRVLLLKCSERLSPGQGRDSRAYDTLQRALDVIEHQHAALSTLSELAAAAAVDPAHLCRLFARFRGESPYRCLIRRKLETAARYLATGSGLVKDAAAAAGFADPLRFSRLFRRNFGCSPTEFQRQWRLGAIQETSRKE